MAVRIVAARKPDPPIDRLVWRLQKAERTAQAIVRLIPNAGLEFSSHSRSHARLAAGGFNVALTTPRGETAHSGMTLNVLGT